MDRPVLAAVQQLKTVEADVGDAQTRALHAVADSLQAGKHTPEHPLVRRLVRFEDDGSGRCGRAPPPAACPP